MKTAGVLLVRIHIDWIEQVWSVVFAELGIAVADFTDVKRAEFIIEVKVVVLCQLLKFQKLRIGGFRDYQ
jgi:hypothetical protein